MSQQVAVIGAGMSGVSCAYHLAAAGAHVEVFDKGRNLGGRLSTRIQDGFAFNHGAPGFSVKENTFKTVINDLIAAGFATDTGLPGAPFIGLPHMNCLLRPLVRDLTVHQSVEVNSLEKQGNAWHLSSLQRQCHGPFDAVAVCIPAAQALTLIKPVKPQWASELEHVQYDPCMTMMIAFQGDYPADRDANAKGHPIILQQIRQAENRQDVSNASCWTAHATPAWSISNMEREQNDIAQDLAAEFMTLHNLSDTQPIFLQGHRWRYARVRRPLGVACLWDVGLQLGLAGDWCLGPDVEHAYESGADLAEQIQANILQG